jgi:hypothetical protein
MFIALLVSLSAYAIPLGSPVTLQDQGQVRVSASLSGEGPPGAGALKDVGNVPTKVLRFDLLPADHFGVWVDAGWTGEASSITANWRDRAWNLGGGMRANAWVGRRFALGVQGRGSYGNDWSTTSAGERRNARAHSSVGGVASLVYGAQEGGLYAWGGPALTARGTQPLVGDTTMDWELSLEQMLGAEVGVEAHSGDLLSEGLRRDLFMSIGGSVHFVDAFGIALWAGFGW